MPVVLIAIEIYSTITHCLKADVIRVYPVAARLSDRDWVTTPAGGSALAGMRKTRAWPATKLGTRAFRCAPRASTAV